MCLKSAEELIGGQGEQMCHKRTELRRVTYAFYSQVNPTSLWCPLGNANLGYGNLASMSHQMKVSTSLLVVIILVCNKWNMWTVQLWDGVSCKNTQFSGLPTGLYQEGHLAVKLSTSIKSCKVSNVIAFCIVMSGVYSRKFSQRECKIQLSVEITWKSKRSWRVHF